MFGRDALRIVRRRVCRSMTQLRPTCDKFGIEMNRVAKMGVLGLRRDRDKKTYRVTSANELCFIDGDLLEVNLGLGRDFGLDRFGARHGRVDV